MAQIILYTHERPGAGLPTSDVARVNGAVELRIITQGQERQIPLGPRADTISTKSSLGLSPSSGKADLLLKFADQSEVNLARCEWAVAVVVTIADSTIY
jgi:hypothetical protein